MSFSATNSIDPKPFIAILFFALLGLVFLYNSPKVQQALELHDLGAIRDGNVCKSTSESLPYWEVEVRIVDFIDIGVAGRWETPSDIIYLSRNGGLDVDTVAHEVYHMVEDVIERYEVTDDHAGAYLQGNWTNCVLSVVHHNGDFRFVD